MFACSADAARRSEGARNPDSRKLLAFYDAINHGTNFLMLTAPLPGGDFIPDNPFEAFCRLLDPEEGALSITEDIAQI